MKKFIILSFVIILFVSCKKESSINESTGEDVQLFGKWEWTESCGGFAGGYYYPEEGEKNSASFFAGWNVLFIQERHNY